MKCAPLLLVILVVLPVTEGWLWRRSRRRSSCTRVDCVWGPWGTWSDCSTPCGFSGIQRRTRIQVRTPACGGSQCSGGVGQVQPCNRECPNGGTPGPSFCACPFPYYGPCCESRGESNSTQPQFEFVSRYEWEARQPTVPRTNIPPASMTFIHHSAGPECNNKAACITLVQGIQDTHMDRPVDPFDDIGYNFLIDGEGKVYEGRGWKVQGAHAPTYNAISHGICFIGTFTDALPTQAAIDTAKALIEYGVHYGHILENYELFGHRDGRCTLCPGDALYREIQSWPQYSDRDIPVTCPTG